MAENQLSETESFHSTDSIEREKQIMELVVESSNFGLKIGKGICFGVGYFLLSKLLLTFLARKVFRVKEKLFIWNIYAFVKY